jgi:hypothetical protein
VGRQDGGFAVPAKSRLIVLLVAVVTAIPLEAQAPIASANSRTAFFLDDKLVSPVPRWENTAVAPVSPGRVITAGNTNLILLFPDKIYTNTNLSITNGQRSVVTLQAHSKVKITMTNTLPMTPTPALTGQDAALLPETADGAIAARETQF